MNIFQSIVSTGPDITTNSLLTQDNITFAIALFGALGTLFTWLVNCLHSRVKLDIHIVKLYCCDSKLVAYISIQNQSKLPVSIENISFSVDGITYGNYPVPKKIFTITSRSGKEITGREFIYSMPFPINLASLAGTSGYVYFEFPKGSLKNLATPLTVRVSTNRNKVVQKKLAFLRCQDPYEML